MIVCNYYSISYAAIVFRQRDCQGTGIPVFYNVVAHRPYTGSMVPWYLVPALLLAMQHSHREVEFIYPIHESIIFL